MTRMYRSARIPRAVSVVLSVMLVLGVSLVIEPRTVLAAGTVGTGSAASCDEAALDAALAGGGNIDFDCGAAPHTITITTTKVISAATSIDGGGLITISGGDSVRIFIVNSGQSLTLQNITLTDGRAAVDIINSDLGLGGAIRSNGTLVLETVTISNSVAASNGCGQTGCTGLGGGIFTSGSLTATDTTITGNTASDGGAIFNRGTVNMTDSVLSGNRGNSGGGGIYNDNANVSLTRTLVDNNTAYGSSGGIMNLGASLTIIDSTISNNSVDVSVGTGGGINNLNGAVTISGSSIVGNTTPQDGAGIYSSASGSSSVSISDSTISGNTAGRNGGGIISGAILSMTNSTVSGNSAPNGGGIYNFRLSGIANPPASEATLTYVTITDNTSGNGAGIRRTGGLVELAGTIVAGNNGVDCVEGSIFPGLLIDSHGHNLDGDGSCSLDQPTDVAGGSANLGPLTDNGGDTPTHMLLGGSQAVNAGAADCGLAEDQRGTSRPQGAACDIGAVEIVNDAPVISDVTAGLTSVAEGGTSTVSVSATDPADDDDDTLQYSFDCDGDGNYEIGPQADSFRVCAFPDDSGAGDSTDVTVNVLVGDPYGATDTASVDVTVNNVAPVLSGFSGDMIDENQTATVSGDIVDLGVLDSFTVTIDWDDGSAPSIVSLPAGTTTFSRSHQYLDGTGSFTVSLTIEDKDGGSDSETVNIVVNNVAPSVDLGTDIDIDEGDSFSRAGSFSDPGSLDTHTATVDFDDGAGPQALALNLDDTFDIANGPYPDDGQFTVEVCVADDEAAGCDQLDVTVQNVAPTIESIETTRSGGTITIEVIASDPGLNDVLTYRFDCDNDGTYETAGVGNQGTCTLDPAAFSTTVGVQVSDDDLGVDIGSVNVEQSLSLCGNLYTGSLRLPSAGGSCPKGTMALELPTVYPVTLCVSSHTGAVIWSRTQICGSSYRTHIVPTDGPLPFCASMWTGQIRAQHGVQGCRSHETWGVIPG